MRESVTRNITSRLKFPNLFSTISWDFQIVTYGHGCGFSAPTSFHFNLDSGGLTGLLLYCLSSLFQRSAIQKNLTVDDIDCRLQRGKCKKDWEKTCTRESLMWDTSLGMRVGQTVFIFIFFGVCGGSKLVFGVKIQSNIWEKRTVELLRNCVI